MARVLLVASRDPLEAQFSSRLLERLRRVVPDNAQPAPPLVATEGDRLLTVVLSPSSATRTRGTSALAGWARDARPSDPASERVFDVGAPVPDGTFALFRTSPEAVELVADPTASRTIWWVDTGALFIASTSQRALALALGSFEPNREAFAWMLSSGALGPGLAWDRRVRALGPSEKLRLDRKTFETRLTQSQIAFSPVTVSEAEHERRLRDVITDVFARIEVDRSRWIVPLSGGFDSRALLLFLPESRGLRTVTWGLASALKDERTDAFIGGQVARALGLEHRYFETDLAREPLERIFQRFLVAGEGRIDHFSGYLDGFAVWRHLQTSGVDGILRGDEGFGWVPVSSHPDVVHSVGLAALRDYVGAPALADLGLGDVHQRLPTHLERQPGESHATWRDRLYHAFRVPYVLGALNELKSSYVEVANPFLSRSILEVVRTEPDELRTNKVLFKRIVAAAGPHIPYATRAATADPGDVLASPRMTEMMSDTLASGNLRALLGPRVAEMLLPRETKTPTLRGRVGELRRQALKQVKAHAKDALPTWMRRAVRNTVAQHRIDRRAMAFRAFIIGVMTETLAADAREAQR